MSRAGTKSVQRRISSSDLDFPGYLNAPHEAKPTAIGLWTKATDVEGRCECNPTILTGLIYPGEAVTEMVIEHLLMLEESGFLHLYQHDGVELVALTRPLRADTRGATSEHPPPLLRGVPRSSLAVGGERAGARERAEQRVQAESDARASQWAEWEQEQERRESTPTRPLLMDAPPIGCPEHPNGRFADCGPCGTARRRHDLWVSTERHTRDLEKTEA